MVKSYRTEEEINKDLEELNKDGWMMDCISTSSEPIRMMDKAYPVIMVGFTRWVPEKTEYKTPDEEFENNIEKGADKNDRRKEETRTN